jgi:flagellar secretion chaperone FliS
MPIETERDIAATNLEAGGQILLMLYDGAIRFLQEAKTAQRSNRIDIRTARVHRSQAIISELRATLQHETAPELCQQLDALYCFMIDQLRVANETSSIAPIDVVINILDDLRSAWRHAVHESEGETAVEEIETDIAIVS